METNNEKMVKILLTYKDEDDIKVESVWGMTLTDDHYKIANIPFFANNIAYGDIITVEKDNGELYYDELIAPSGHSTIQMVIFGQLDEKQIGNDLVLLGCDWEGSHLKSYISVDVPKEVSYKAVKDFLEQGADEGKWDYKEACLSDEHQL